MHQSRVGETISSDTSAAIESALQRFCAVQSGRAAAWAPLDGAGRGVNADAPMPCASVIKIAVAMALADKFASGALDPETAVAVSTLPDTRYCSILKGFDDGARLSLREMVRIGLITSDNPIAVKLMAFVSLAEVNAAMRAHGISSRSVAAAGFAEADLGPANRVNLLTANDAIRLVKAVAAAPRYAFIRVALENNLRNTRIPRLLPETAVIAHKTGSLAGVVNDVGMVYGAGMPFALAFLSDHQSDPWATEADIAACSLAIYEALASSAA
jgi:beta-lactamase class A